MPERPSPLSPNQLYALHRSRIWNQIYELAMHNAELLDDVEQLIHLYKRFYQPPLSHGTPTDFMVWTEMLQFAQFVPDFNDRVESLMDLYMRMYIE